VLFDLAEPLVLAAGEQRELKLGLDTVGVIQGFARRPDGAPCPAITLWLLRAEAAAELGQRETARSGPDGRGRQLPLRFRPAGHVVGRAESGQA
jgi:hypothetical protein